MPLGQAILPRAHAIGRVQHDTLKLGATGEIVRELQSVVNQHGPGQREVPYPRLKKSVSRVQRPGIARGDLSPQQVVCLFLIGRMM